MCDAPAVPVRVHRGDSTRVEAAALDCLSQEERARARRFASARGGRRYATGRAFLRVVLARHLGMDPRSVVFRYSNAGKPEVAGIHFNLAHCEDVFMVAVSDRPVGIDVERFRVASATLARRVLAPRALIHWHALPPSRRGVAFTRAWVRKEACAKALGGGLGAGVMRADVGLMRHARPRHVRHDETSLVVSDVDAPPGYAAAVAIVPATPAAAPRIRVSFRDDDLAPIDLDWARSPRRASSGSSDSRSTLAPRVPTETVGGRGL